MTLQERAKQFQPFDAMKGLQEALRDREERHSRVERHDISDEAAERNSLVIAKLTKGVKVRLSYYHAFHDIVAEGRVNEVNICFKYIKVDGEKIFFDDIYEIGVVDNGII